MKINRLLEIVIILLGRESITAKQLAERFNVSVRTIYRDIEDLSLAGIPIYTNKGNGGGIALLEEYTLSKAILSEDEKERLLMTLQTLEATKQEKNNEMIEKLGMLFQGKESTDWVEVQFSQWNTYKPVDDKFEAIKEAILSKKLISFEYMNSYGEKANRVVCPLKLLYKGQAWYLKGYCKEKEGYRIFRISRMKAYSILEETFNRRGLIKEMNQKEPANHMKTIHLVLKFSKEVLYLLYDMYEEAQIIKNEDGTYTVETSFPDNDWIYAYILSFGRSVEVIEPMRVREEIKKRLEDALENYRSQ